MLVVTSTGMVVDTDHKVHVHRVTDDVTVVRPPAETDPRWAARQEVEEERQWDALRMNHIFALRRQSHGRHS